MRASIIVILAFAAEMIVVVATSRNHNYFNVPKQPKYSEHRIIRTIAPPESQTSYGYGKRQSFVDAPEMTKHGRILSTLLEYFPQGIPVEWLLQQIKTNPTFAAKLTRLLMDERTDLVSMDHSNPERTTWLY
ncbi:uncharacterized protein LOC128896108 [Hylaeus anthracinus]|uniref:uncharacterized protein LOC128876643 n=1 Tax=Hylaeus volcanicus TaxID=313075 RepID=UPI0023B87E1A|nr:uncharacterized protein LOC128876643 [Hylaeus volcanicus]XP_054015279.1 uncharacterized protein LOC128896108 [Hylaeus anthracinus]